MSLRGGEVVHNRLSLLICRASDETVCRFETAFPRQEKTLS